MALYTPHDVREAYDAWKATCGPAALAAVLGRDVMELMPAFPNFPGYMNPTALKAALRSLGVHFLPITGANRPPEARGLQWIQFTGPWTGKEVPSAAAYKKTHWIGFHDDENHRAIYDINWGWVPADAWSQDLVHELEKEHTGCTGWLVRQTFLLRGVE